MKDIDGDGKLDVALVMYGPGSGGGMAVYRNTTIAGSSSLTLVSAYGFTFSNGTNPRGLTVADFDGDGRVDIAISGSNTGAVSVFRNLSVSGTVSFSSIVTTLTFSGSNTDSYGIASGDLDQDGKVDLLVSNLTSANAVYIYRNISVTGTINFNQVLSLTSGMSQPSRMSIGDFDGDTRLDIAVANGGGSILFYHNNSSPGNISFPSVASPAFSIVGGNNMDIGDVDGDGKVDLAMINSSGNNLYIIRNTSISGSISFTNTRFSYTTGATPYWLTIDDMNLDGRPDIATANIGNNTISFFRNIAFPSPVIIALSPLSGTIGTTVTITGQNFNPTLGRNVVFFGATSATVNTASSTTLTVTVPYGANYQYLSVTNLDYNTTGYSASPFVVMFPNSVITDFAYEADLASTSPGHLSLGDLNGDGKPDLVVANISAGFNIYLNTSTPSGAISYVLNQILSSGLNQVTGVSLKDIDGDGKLDIVLGVYGPASGGQMGVYRNTTALGSASLTFASVYTAGVSGNPREVTVADFDGDGRPDIGTAGANTTFISVFRNLSVSGTITFGNLQLVTVSAGNTDSYGGLSNGDLDGDGKVDLVVSDYGGSQAIILRNVSSTGTIAFNTAITLNSSNSINGVHRIAIGDFDGDNKPDLAMANYGASNILFFRNNSTPGTISFPTTPFPVLSTGANPTDVSIGDMNGDGKIDLAVANINSNTLSVLRNNSVSGSLSFTNRVNYTTGSSPYWLSVGDMNSDGKPDIAVTYNGGSSISLFRNLATNILPPILTTVTPLSSTISSTVIITGQNFSASGNNVVFFGATQATVQAGGTSTTLSVTVPIGANYQYISVTNMDTKFTGYSALPFVVIYPTIGTVSDFAPVQALSGFTAPWSHVVKDFNGDGKPDIVVTNTNTVSLLLNTTPAGSTIFSFSPTTISVGTNLSDVRSDDFDGDGKPDLAISDYSYSSPRVYIYRNISSSNSLSFTYICSLAATGGSNSSIGSIWSVPIGDLDGDGRPDIAAVSDGTGPISVFRNTSPMAGVITFDNKVDFGVDGNYKLGGILADIDGDGKLDIIAECDNEVGLNILRNTTSGPGNITFAIYVNIPNGGDWRSVAGGDFNGDGKLDLVSATNLNSIAVSLNKAVSGTIGTGSFSPTTGFAGQTDTRGVAIGDINGDGKPDVVVLANNTSSAYNVSIFKNTAIVGANAPTFATRVDYPTQTNPFNTLRGGGRISLADLNGDGMLDVITSNPYSNNISLLRNLIATPIIVSSFTPTSGPIGQLVTITGQNFNPTANRNVVYFGATSATVQAVQGSTTLTVTVPYGANYQYLSVTNLDYNTTGYSASPFVVIFPTNGITDFAYDPIISAASAHHLSLGDLNGDGKPDLVVANYNVSNSNVYVYLNTCLPSGVISYVLNQTLNPGSSYSGGSVLKDMDGDGKLDIALAVYNSGGTGVMAVYRNTTAVGSNSITFAPVYTQNVSGNARDITVADFDGDGRPDIATSGDNSTAISLFRNLSVSGTISFATLSACNVSGANMSSYGIKSGDLDQDGKVDIVVTDLNSSVFVLHNSSVTGTISFTIANTLTTGINQPHGIAIGDFDGDNKPDIGVTNRGVSTITIFRNASSNGTMNFPTANSLTMTSPPTDLSIGDFDGDGKIDLAVANYNISTLLVLKNNSVSGSLSFTNRVTYIPGANPYWLAVGDMNSDGKPDIAVASNGGGTISFFRNLATNISPPQITLVSPISGTINSTTITITGQNFNSIPSSNIVFFGSTSATVIATGSTSTTLLVNIPLGASYQYISVTDAVTKFTGYSNNPVVVTYATPVGSFNQFAPVLNISLTGDVIHHVIKDFNGDGKPDIVVTNYGGGTIYLFTNTTPVGSNSITFTIQSMSIASASTIIALAADDLNGDGKPDLAIGNWGSGPIYIYQNVSAVGGAISFTNTNISLSGVGGEYSLGIGDIDSDGRPDIVMGSGSSLNVYRNTSASGTMNFDPVVSIANSGSIQRVVIGDMNGDGKPDVVTANTTTNNLSILRNTTTGPGSITFAASYNFGDGGNSSYGLALGDFNGDGWLDLAVADNGANRVSIYRNAQTSTIGAGSFGAAVTVTSSNPFAVAIGDVDGDGKPDLLALSYNIPAIVSVYKNTTASSTTLSFAGEVDYSSNSTGSTQYPPSLSLADVNSDGMLDVVTTNRTNSTISIFRNTIITPPIFITDFNPKQGTLTPTTTVTITGGGFASSAAQNAVFFGSTSATITAASTGSLTVTVPYGASYQYISVTNLVTNVTAYSARPFVVTYPTLPLGSLNEFAPGVNLGTNTVPWGHVIKDFNGDGRPDIIVISNTAAPVLFINTTSPGSVSYTFTTQVLTGLNAVGSSPNATAIASDDFDGDGLPDLAIVNYNTGQILVYRNTTTITTSVGFTTTAVVAAATANLWSVVIGDLDGDGKPDLIGSGTGSTNVSVFRNTSATSGTISFGPKQDFGGNGNTNYTVVLGDIDGDGKPDIITANDNASNVSVFRNISTGPGGINFASQVSFGNGGPSYSLAVGDFNGDGKLDVASTGGSNSASILLNKAVMGTIDANSFSPTVSFLSLPNSYGIAAGDINGDGKPDMVVFSNNAIYNVSVYRNTTVVGSGTPTFASRLDYVAQGGGAPSHISLADLNSDGMLDVVTASGGNANNISILRNIIVTPIIVNAFTPTSGPIGQLVTITGQNFNPAANRNVVFFGATSATVQSVQGSTTLTVTVPYGANYQYLSVTNLDYNTTGYSASPFVVIFPNQ